MGLCLLPATGNGQFKGEAAACPPPQCASRTDLVREFGRCWGERPEAFRVMSERLVFELLFNARTGSYTILSAEPEGACVVRVGKVGAGL
jgi:hypothetical protein